jgi:zeaxanthin glucosyltransferase
MAHLALICPPFHAHLRVFEALAEELGRRGHRTTFLLNAGGEVFVRPTATAVRTPPATAEAHDLLARTVRHAEAPGGILGILRTVRDSAALTDGLCSAGPGILRDIGADAVIGDQLEPAAGLIAAGLGLPHASIAAALPINRDPGIPLPFLPWRYDPSPAGEVRVRGGHWVGGILMRRQAATIARWAERFGLAPRRSLEDCLSPTLQIAQTVRGFDFPRPATSPLHHVGPMRIREPMPAPLPFALDPDRPLVFATFGTLQGHRLATFRAAAEACRALGAQLLVAHGGRLSARDAAAIGADAVTDFVSYPAAMARAAVCLTHGGSSTVLAALEAGVPLLVAPVTFDQPGNAARVVHHRVGLHIPLSRLTARRLRHALGHLIEDAETRRRAARLGREVADARGAAHAADLIERRLLRQR